MRVIAGSRRGMTLAAVPGEETRPTADRVKEATFNVIQDHIVDANVLDVFAGTGAIGIEALSRGARSCLFIEQNPAAIKVLRKNISKARFEDLSEIRVGESLSVLKGLSNREKFDIIYLDPPYAAGLYERALTLIANKHMLSENGIIIVEAAKNTLFSCIDKVFLTYKTKTYGDTSVTYFTQKHGESGGK